MPRRLVLDSSCAVPITTNSDDSLRVHILMTGASQLTVPCCCPLLPALLLPLCPAAASAAARHQLSPSAAGARKLLGWPDSADSGSYNFLDAAVEQHENRGDNQNGKRNRMAGRNRRNLLGWAGSADSSSSYSFLDAAAEQHENSGDDNQNGKRNTNLMRSRAGMAGRSQRNLLLLPAHLSGECSVCGRALLQLLWCQWLVARQLSWPLQVQHCIPGAHAVLACAL